MENTTSSAHVDSNNINAAVSAATSNKSDLASLTDWHEKEDLSDFGHLETIRLTQEPKYISLFTTSMAMADVHYLAADGSLFSGGYYRCLGKDCPACKATVEKKSFLMLPVADLEDGLIKLLRIPKERGVGKLATELSKVLSLEDPSKVITVVSRGSDYKYSVSTQQNGEFPADIAEAIKRFEQNVSDGVVDINDAILTLSAEEMATHSRIAKRLKLVGNA